MKNSIPYSLILRIKRICSIVKDFGNHTQELKERFVKQGYDLKLINEYIQKLNQLNRSELLGKKNL